MLLTSLRIKYYFFKYTTCWLTLLVLHSTVVKDIYPYVPNLTLVHINTFLFLLAVLFDYSLVIHKNIASLYFMVLYSLDGTETMVCFAIALKLTADFFGPLDCYR